MTFTCGLIGKSRRQALLALGIGLGTFAVSAPAQANDLSFNLTLNVPVMCSIFSVEQQSAFSGVVYRVGAACNTDQFRLHAGGDLASLPISSAAAVGPASVNAMGDTLLVSPSTPGAFFFDIGYGEEAKEAQAIAFAINAY